MLQVSFSLIIYLQYLVVFFFFLSIKLFIFFFLERFNETIFDALPTYLLNICEVCGSSQCPYCPIYNSAVQLSIPVILISVATFIFAYVYKNQNLMT